MKQSAVLSAVALLVYLSLFGSTIVIGEGDSTVKEVLVGEVHASTMKIKFTGGTLANDKGSSSFQSYSVASKVLRNRGVSKKAIEDLEQRLRESIALLEKRNNRVSDWPSQLGLSRTAEYELMSILEVKKKGYGDIYEFRVLTGDAENVATALKPSGNDVCERLNDKCFICPDGKIRCVTTALTNERDSWRRSFPGKGNNDD